MVFIVSYIYRAHSSGCGTWTNKHFETIEEASAYCQEEFKRYLKVYHYPEEWNSKDMEWEYDGRRPSMEHAEEYFSVEVLKGKLEEAKRRIMAAEYTNKVPESHEMVFGPYSCFSGNRPYEMIIREI